MSSNVLADRDINAHLGAEKMNSGDPKSMEYHRQVLQSRMKDESVKESYVSPSDQIMSPCTAKLAAMKSKHFTKAKPQSLFAKKIAAVAPTSTPLQAEETVQTMEKTSATEKMESTGTA